MSRSDPAVEEAVAQMLAEHLANPAAASMLAVTLSAAGLLREGPLAQGPICAQCDKPIDPNGDTVEMPQGERVHQDCWPEAVKGMRR